MRRMQAALKAFYKHREMVEDRAERGKEQCGCGVCRALYLLSENPLDTPRITIFEALNLVAGLVKDEASSAQSLLAETDPSKLSQEGKYHKVVLLTHLHDLLKALSAVRDMQAIIPEAPAPSKGLH